MSCTLTQLMNQNDLLNKHFSRHAKKSSDCEGVFVASRETLLNAAEGYIRRLAAFESSPSAPAEEKERAKELYFYWQIRLKEITGRFAQAPLSYFS